MNYLLQVKHVGVLHKPCNNVCKHTVFIVIAVVHTELTTCNVLDKIILASPTNN